MAGRNEVSESVEMPGNDTEHLNLDMYGVNKEELCSSGTVSSINTLNDDMNHSGILAGIDFYAKCIESSPCLFVAVDVSGRVMMMNTTMLKALGYEKMKYWG